MMASGIIELSQASCGGESSGPDKASVAPEAEAGTRAPGPVQSVAEASTTSSTLPGGRSDTHRRW